MLCSSARSSHQRCSIRGCLSDIASSYHFRPSKVTEHVTSRLSGDEFETK